jgi:glycine betaine/proline transport system permease protein
VIPAERTAGAADRAHLIAWAALAALSALILLARHRHPWLQAPPDSIVMPLSPWTKSAVLATAESFQTLFRAIAGALDLPIRALRDLLVWIPWPVSILLAAAVGHASGGWRIAAFTAASLFYIVVVGFWPEAMMTLSVVGVAVLAAVAFGLALGILMHRSAGVRHAVEPVLDVMQTVPTFSYLVPILVLFGLGPVVGMIAAAIYAVPPMARNAYLSLSRVPPATVEAGQMAGSTRLQLLAWVQLPTAMSGMLLGINQAIMAVLSMAVIASILGGAPDIGWEVYLTMKRAQFGESIVAGLVIAVMAMVLDRISRGFAGHGEAGRPARRGRRSTWLATAAAAVLLLLAAEVVPALDHYPAAWELNLAPPLNQAVQWFTATFFVVTEALKNMIVFYLLLPLKIGFAGSVRPQTWGFELGAAAVIGYAAAWGLAAAGAGAWRGWRAGVAVAVLAVVYFFGTTGLPWLVLILIWAVIAWQVAGIRTAGLTIAGFAFIALSGFWEGAMVTLQLCGAGVIVSFILGGVLGIWAALDDRVSIVLRPISDVLQTIPIFVFLIPAIMVFLVGEFTALVAIVLYAVVPAARYVEHGIRHVPPQVLEAATACGATKRQLLLHVQLPLALPEIMLGLNQTIMMGLSMVIVAALAGARGLGQDIMIALTWMEVGNGLVAGFCVAAIAISTDRIIQAWSSRKKIELGLAESRSS